MESEDHRWEYGYLITCHNWILFYIAKYLIIVRTYHTQRKYQNVQDAPHFYIVEVDIEKILLPVQSEIKKNPIIHVRIILQTTKLKIPMNYYS